MITKIDNQDSLNINDYTFIAYISILMSTFINFSIISYSKIIYILGVHLTCGAIFFPIGYTLGDLIAYKYGKDIAKKIFLFVILSDVIFSVLGFILYFLPSLKTIELDRFYYIVFLKNGLMLSIFVATGIIISQSLNLKIFFMSKLRNYNFLLRSITAAALADLFISIFGILPLIFTNNLGVYDGLYLMLSSALSKWIFSFITSVFIQLYINARRILPTVNTISY